jgi:hypothetical protein
VAIPPLDIHLEMVKHNTAIRLSKITLLSPITQRLPNKWRNYSPPSIPPPIPTNINPRPNAHKTTSPLKLAIQHDHNCERISTIIPPWTDMSAKSKGRLTILDTTCPTDKREETAKRHTLSVRAVANDQTTLMIYTDSSKTKEGTGASYIAYHKGRTIVKKSLGMGHKAEAFDAEKWALAKSIKWAVKFTSIHLHNNIKTLNFYIDNAAVVKTTYDITPSSGQWIGKLTAGYWYIALWKY